MFDFGVGYSELFVLALIAVIVIGPKDLPRVLRMFGQTMNKMRGMAREFQTHVDVAMKDAGVGDLKKDLQAIKGFGAMPNIKDTSTTVSSNTMMPLPTAASGTNDFATFFGAGQGETRIAGERNTAS
jgi:sec-independent protein translocase protein TatB